MPGFVSGPVNPRRRYRESTWLNRNKALTAEEWVQSASSHFRPVNGRKVRLDRRTMQPSRSCHGLTMSIAGVAHSQRDGSIPVSRVIIETDMLAGFARRSTASWDCIPSDASEAENRSIVRVARSDEAGLQTGRTRSRKRRHATCSENNVRPRSQS